MLGIYATFRYGSVFSKSAYLSTIAGANMLPCGGKVSNCISSFVIRTSATNPSPDEVVSITPKHGFRESVLKFLDHKIGLTFPEKYREKDLHIASHVLLNSIYMKLDFATIRKHANLDDTFGSWLNIVYIHIWMLLVKLKQHGRDGRIMNKAIVHLMWEDLFKRAKGIEKEIEQDLSVSKQMRDYLNMLKCSFMLYDEGLLKGDAVLANNLWNQIYFCEEEDPRCLECLIHHIRFTMAKLENTPMDRLVLDPESLDWPLPKQFGVYD